MNTAFLLMSSAFVAGADAPAPVPAAPVAAPIAAPITAGCGCGAAAPSYYGGCCDSYGVSKPGFFSRFKLGGAGCGCGTPLFHGFTTAAPCGCDPCAGVERHGWGSGPGLFSRLRSKFSSGGCCGDAYVGSSCGSTGCCTPGYGVSGGCALPPVPGAVTPTVPAAPPEKMPAPPAAGKTAILVPGLTPAAGERSPF